MKKNKNNFIQKNSPDGGFLQSNEWRNFQEVVGRKTYHLEMRDFWANIIEHQLPIIGKYFYIPRGPVVKIKFDNQLTEGINFFKQLINLAQENQAGWIRMDILNKKILAQISAWASDVQVEKAPHDMQPRQILIMDIRQSPEQVLAQMKAKTRYNIKLAQRKGVQIHTIIFSQDKNQQYFKEFLRLTQIMAKRQNIVVHPVKYYQKMWESIAEEKIKLYVAKYKNKIIAANLVVFYGKVATYLHGASDNQYRNVMAPFLLQWQTILDAQKRGCEQYDLGGVSVGRTANKLWLGITRFKRGLAPKTEPLEFLGSYDLVINPMKYKIYKIGQIIKLCRTILKNIKSLKLV